MKRRRVLGAATATGAVWAACLSAHAAKRQRGDCRIAHGTLGCMSIEAFREDCRRRIFDQYLPYWEKGGIDREHGGFLCELNDDGSVAGDEESIWHQGRGLWVYTSVYNHFGKNLHWLDVAAKARTSSGPASARNAKTTSTRLER